MRIMHKAELAAVQVGADVCLLRYEHRAPTSGCRRKFQFFKHLLYVLQISCRDAGHAKESAGNCVNKGANRVLFALLPAHVRCGRKQPCPGLLSTITTGMGRLVTLDSLFPPLMSTRGSPQLLQTHR